MSNFLSNVSISTPDIKSSPVSVNSLLVVLNSRRVLKRRGRQETTYMYSEEESTTLEQTYGGARHRDPPVSAPIEVRNTLSLFSIMFAESDL